MTAGTTFSRCVEFVASKMKRATGALSLGLAALGSFFFTSVPAPADYIYVSNSGNDTIMRFDSNGNGIIFASSGLSSPAGLAFDSSGNLYVANAGDNTIMEFDSSGSGSVFANSGLNGPAGLAFDGSGNLFVLNEGDGTIMKFGPSGTGSLFVSIHTGISPQGPVFDESGNLYVAISDPPYGIVSIEKFDSMGAGSQLALIFNPVTRPVGGGLAFDSSGNLYVALAGGLTNAIDKVDSSGHVSPFANSGLAFPRGLAFDSGGSLFVANWGNNTIEAFDASGNGYVFASGLNRPMSIAIQVPEPATWTLLVLGAVALLAGRRLRRRPS